MAASYVVLAVSVEREERVLHRIGPVPDGAHLKLEIQIVSIDAANDSMHLRISATPSRELRGRRLRSPDRNLTLLLDDDNGAQELTFRADEPMGSAVIDVNLNDGLIAKYPLDTYRAMLRIAAHDQVGASLPVWATVSEGVSGWTSQAEQVLPPVADTLALRCVVARSSALVVLVVFLYAAMVLVAVAAISIGLICFRGLRPAESTLLGALGSVLFALPALRYALPGAPPLGVRADLLVFYWAELAVQLGLLLFVVAWVRGITRR